MEPRTYHISERDGRFFASPADSEEEVAFDTHAAAEAWCRDHARRTSESAAPEEGVYSDVPVDIQG